MQKIRFVAIVAVIALLNWVDVDYFGSARFSQYSTLVRHTAHLFVLAATFTLGLIHYKSSPKTWTIPLWCLLYGAGLVITVLVAILVLAHFMAPVGEFFETTVFLRILLEGPMPFLTFSLLTRLGEGGKSTD